MAVKTKRTQLGNYITKVNNYDIRQKVTYKKSERGGRFKTLQVASSEYVVYRGRKVIKAGFKNIEEASNYANNR